MAGGLTPEMRAELAELGFHPKRRFGQNFMRDGNMIATLVREAGVKPGNLVLEPGPGAGALTSCLLENGGRVIGVELDRTLAAYLRKRFAAAENFTLLEGDILDRGRTLNRRVLQEIGERSFVLASNLPYSAATPFLIALAASGLNWTGGAVTVQKEAAERLAADPGTGKYGAATVILASRADAALVRKVPPEVFWPQPRVESAILRVTPLSAPLVQSAELPSFSGFMRSVFSLKRKRLARGLQCAGLDAGQTAAALEQCGISGDVRPAQVSPAGFVNLWRAGSSDKQSG